MGAEHVAAATLTPETAMKVHDMPSYMERVAYPPEYDEPYTTAKEVLRVVFGRATFDGRGRDFADLMSDTDMRTIWERISCDPVSEEWVLKLIGQHLNEAPQQLRDDLNELAAEAAKGDAQ